MADTKISAETSAGALDGTEIVPVVRGTGSPPTYSNLRTTTQDIADLGGGGGALSLVSTLTANNTAASLEWTGLTDSNYLIVVRALQPATNVVDIYLQFGTGAGPTWGTSGYHSGNRYWVESSGVNGLTNYVSQAGIIIANVVDNTNGGLLSTIIKMFGLSLSNRHSAMFETMRLNAGVVANLIGAGTASGTTAKTAVRLITSAGNLASGTASLYSLSQ